MSCCVLYILSLVSVYIRLMLIYAIFCPRVRRKKGFHGVAFFRAIHVHAIIVYLNNYLLYAVASLTSKVLLVESLLFISIYTYVYVP